MSPPPPPPDAPPHNSGPGETPPPGRPSGGSTHAQSGSRLTRSSDDRMVAGVAGGLARHFGYDPALVRLAIATLGVVTFGTAFAGYLVAWLVIPQDDGRLVADELRGRAEHHRDRFRASDRRSRRWLGIGLFVIGLIALSDNTDHWPGTILSPLALIAVGGLILFSHRDTRDDRRDHHHDDRRDNPVAVSYPATTPGSASPAGPGTAEEPTQSAFPPGRWPGSDTGPPMAHPLRHHRRHERSVLGRLVLSVVVMTIGAAWFLDAANAITVNPAFVAALVLSVLGAGLVVGAWVGRSRGLIVLAVVLTAFCATASAVDLPLRGGVGERVERPTTVAETRTPFELALGELTVDLTQVEGDEPLTIIGRIGIGKLVVIVANDASVSVDSRIDLGAITHFERQHDDGGYHQHETTTAAGSGRRISIDINGGIGEIKVERDNRSALSVATEGAST